MWVGGGKNYFGTESGVEFLDVGRAQRVTSLPDRVLMERCKLPSGVLGGGRPDRPKVSTIFSTQGGLDS